MTIELDFMEYLDDAAAQAAYISDGVSNLPTPLIHYKMNDAAPTTNVIDSSGNSNDGISIQNTEDISIVGKLSNALNFVNDNVTVRYIISESVVAIKNDEDRTICCWAKQLQSLNGSVLFLGNPITADDYIFGFRVSGGDWIFVADSSYTLSELTGEWEFLAVVHDSATHITKVYVDMVLILTISPVTHYTGNGENRKVIVGNHSVPHRSKTFGGGVDDVRIYNEPLSLDELNAVFNDGIGTEETIPILTYLQAYSEDSIIQQGSHSLKIAANATTSLNKKLTKTIDSPLDLSGINTIYCNVRASRTGSQFKIAIHDSGGTTTEHTVNILSADAWQLERWDISAVADVDKNEIDSIIITVVNADNDNIIYIDNLFAGSLEVSGAVTAESSLFVISSCICKVDGSFESQSIVSGGVSVYKCVIGIVTNQSILSGALHTIRKISGVITGQLLLTGDVTEAGTIEVGGVIGGQSIVSGEAKAIKKVIGSISSLSILSGVLNTNREISGEISGITSLSGEISSIRSISGSISASSEIIGAVKVYITVTYTAFPFILEPAQQGSKGEIPNYLLKISNVTKLLQPYLQEYSGGVNASVKITVVNSGLLAEDYSELEIECDIIATQSTAEWVIFTLGASNLLRQRFPLNRYIALHCRWRFGTVECGYIGETITAITKASTAKVSVTNHPFKVGDVLVFSEVVGMTEINDLSGTVQEDDPDADGNAFTININSSAFTNYISGGVVGYLICDRTLASCRERDNSVRFGGFAGMRTGGVRIA